LSGSTSHLLCLGPTDHMLKQRDDTIRC
jgi:hypothetical protein